MGHPLVLRISKLALWIYLEAYVAGEDFSGGGLDLDFAATGSGGDGGRDQRARYYGEGGWSAVEADAGGSGEARSQNSDGGSDFA